MNTNATDTNTNSDPTPTPDSSTDEIELEVFRAGDYGARGDWPAERLDAIAADYDPDLHEAPVTLDHAQSGPALGWVAGVRRSGDRLVARVRAAGAELIDSLRRGTFKKRSVELYPALPETGRPYLKAVSLLGAAAPAVRGLRDPRFSEGGGAGAGEEWTEWTEWTKWTESAPPAPAPAPAPPPVPAPRPAPAPDASPVTHPPAPDPAYVHPVPAVHPVHAVHAVHTVHSDATRTLAFADLERDLRAGGRWRPVWGEMGAREFHAFLESLESPAASPNPDASLASVDGSERQAGCLSYTAASPPAPARFVEGIGIPALGGRTPARWFADFLHAMPPLLPMGEAAPANAYANVFAHSTPGRTPDGRTPAIPFSDTVPCAPNLDAESVARHRRAAALVRECPGLDYASALLRADRAV